MRIAIDIDGPVADFGTEFVRYCDMRFNRQNSLLQIDKWHFQDCTDFKLSKEEFDIAFREFNKHFLGDIPIVNGAREGICALHEAGYDIVFITARDKNVRDTTAYWLLKNAICAGSLLFVENKEKAIVAKALSCKWAIEDKPSTCVDYLANGINTIVWDMPYNSDITTHMSKPLKVRTNSWKVIVANLVNLAGN